MVGEQHCVVLAGQGADRLGEFLVARREIGDERQPADAHDEIGGQRRQRVRRIDFIENAHRDRVGRMQVNDGAAIGALLVHDDVQERFLGRRIAVDQMAAASKRDRRAGSSAPSEALVGVISQPPSSSRTEMLPVEPKVSPRANSEAPTAQISSRA